MMGFFDGSPTGYGQPSESFGDGMMPPMMMMMGMPPPLPMMMMGMSPPPQSQQTTRAKPTKMEAKGIKVPKDPFVERQKSKSRINQSSSISSGSSSSKAPKEDSEIKTPPKGESTMKIPKDPFTERRGKDSNDQEEPKRRGRPPKTKEGGTIEVAGNNCSDTKVPKDPFLERLPQTKILDTNKTTMINDALNSPSNDVNGTGSGIKRPKEPTMTLKRKQGQLSHPITTAANAEEKDGFNSGLPGGVSFGVRMEEDMTTEEFSSYFGDKS